MFDMGGCNSILYGHQPQLGEELLTDKFYDDFVQSLFEPNDAGSNNYTTSSTSGSSGNGFLPLPYFECFPTEQSLVSFPPEFDDQCYLDCCYQNPKRQKTNSYNDLHYSMNTFSQYPEFFFPRTESIQLPPMVYENTTTTPTAKKISLSSDKGLSVQSVAARQRRRKISDKTQELGKLIPGSNRMNSTADMFQAAYKYVQYLQAQVGILQLMQQGSQENVPIVEGGLEVLLASPTIQEKLYSEEKCLVPQNFVEALAKDNEIIQSNPSISKDIVLLTQSNQGVILPLE
ncbi:Transcription factor bhlh [Thalictrum thalictroides]|uniref:Transcription factor bhlh n=1 Tax=Thalictrum thalictroides TaxID=46969 RepID=A0A7J6WNK9_THATH|nr:Transcription factor bhlh [Thalictrum thalictroides]